MATHSSILAWTEELGGLQFIGLQRVGHYRSDLHMHVDCEVRYIWVSYCVSVMLFSLILLGFYFLICQNGDNNLNLAKLLYTLKEIKALSIMLSTK